MIHSIPGESASDAGLSTQDDVPFSKRNSG
jgi:hypothetical protein